MGECTQGKGVARRKAPGRGKVAIKHVTALTTVGGDAPTKRSRISGSDGNGLTPLDIAPRTRHAGDGHIVAFASCAEIPSTGIMHATAAATLMSWKRI